MELKFFPIGSYVKLRKGGGWWEIVRFEKDLVYLKAHRKQKGAEAIRGKNQLVADWLVGRNSSTSKLEKPKL